MASGRKFKVDPGTKRGLGVLVVITVTIIVGAVLFRQTQLGNPYMQGPDAAAATMGSTYTSSMLDPTDAELVCYGEKYNFRKENRSVGVLRDHWYQYGRVMGRFAHCPRSGGEAPALSDEEAQRYLDGYADLKFHFKTDLVKAKEHYKVQGWKEGRIVPDKPVSFWGKTINLIGGKNDKLFCGVSASDKSLSCDKQTITPGEEFEVTKVSESQFALKNKSTNQYCRDFGDKIVCNSDAIGSHEKFDFIHMGKQRMSFWGPKSGESRKWCSDEGTRINCNRPVTGTWELFKWSEAATLTEGDSVRCENDKSKVYRYTEDQLRHYPDPETATLWDPNWMNYSKLLSAVECGKLKIGVPMTKPGIQPASSATSTTAVSGTTATITPLSNDEARRYLAAYGDIQSAFGNDIEKAKNHWIEHGFKENRKVPVPSSTSGSQSISTMATTTTYDLTTPTTTATVTTPAVAFVTPVEGSSVTCGDGKVYRYTGGTLRYYPSPEIAAAWNPQWDKGIRVLSASECAGIPVSFPMEMPVKTNAATVTTPAVVFVTPVEGSSVTCQGRDGIVYRYTGGMLRQYRSSEIAAAWNPQWATGVRVLTAVECAGLPLGSPMEMPVTTNVATATNASSTQNQFASSSTATAAQTSAASEEPASETMAEDESPKTVTQVQTGGNMTPFIVAAVVATALIFADHVM